MGTSFWIYARGSWRRLDETSGRVTGWRDRPRFCFYRRGRLEIVNSSTVLRGLRALKNRQPTTVRNGIRLSQSRNKDRSKVPKRPRCCCSHKCQHTDARSALVQLNLSAPCANSTQTSVSALQPVKTDAAVQANVEHEQVPEPHVPDVQRDVLTTIHTGVCREGSEFSTQPDCKELIVNEEDVSALRSFLAQHNMLDVDLRRFDTDDEYKSSVFYKINPLVCLERCPKVSAMLTQRSPQCSLREFTRVLGLREVGAPRRRTRRAHSDKENQGARPFPNKSANKSAKTSDDYSADTNDDSDSNCQSDSDFQSRTYITRNNNVSSQYSKRNKKDHIDESDQAKDVRKRPKAVEKSHLMSSGDVGLQRRKSNRIKEESTSKNVDSTDIQTSSRTQVKETVESDESLSILQNNKIFISRRRDGKFKKRPRVKNDSKKTDTRDDKRRYRDSLEDSDDENTKKSEKSKLAARTVGSVMNNMQSETNNRRRSLRSLNSSPTKSVDSRSRELRFAHRQERRHHSVEEKSSDSLSDRQPRYKERREPDSRLKDSLRKNVIGRDRGGSQENRYEISSDSLPNRQTTDKERREMASVDSRSKGSLRKKENLDRERNGSQENRERSNHLRHRHSTSSESDIQLRKQINEKNAKRRSGRLQNDSLHKNAENKPGNNLNVGRKHVDAGKSSDEARDESMRSKRQRGLRASTLNSSASEPLRREYSPLEDHAIVQYLLLGSRASKVNGNAVWRELESQFARIAGRTRSWHSLRNRYLRSILPALGALALPPGKVAALRAAQAHGEIKSKRRPPAPLLLAAPPVRSAWAARPRARLPVTDDEDEGTQNTVEDSQPPPAVPRPARAARSPTYSELTRRFAAKRSASTPESITRPELTTQNTRQDSVSPPPKRTRRLYNPSMKL